jgi:hypothetical protein
MYNLALCHLEGVGVPKNDALGRSWIRRAAAAGHTRAQLARARAAEEVSRVLDRRACFSTTFVAHAEPLVCDWFSLLPAFKWKESKFKSERTTTCFLRART